MKIEKTKEVLTFVIVARDDKGFTPFMSEANHIMDYGNGIIIHSPQKLVTLLKHCVDDLEFRVLIHLGREYNGAMTGHTFYDTLKTELGIEDMVIVTRDSPTFPNDEMFKQEGVHKIYNASRINNIEFVNKLKVYKKSDLKLFKESHPESSVNETNKCDEKIDIVIITALYYDEMEKIKEVFNLKNDQHKLSIGKHSGYKFSYNNKNIIAVSQTEMGMVDAAILTTKMINDYKPEYVIMPGVCGGGKETSFGSIILSKKVELFFTGKLTDAGFEKDNIQETLNEKFIENIKSEITTTEDGKIKGIIPEIEEILRTTELYKVKYKKFIEKELKSYIEPTGCSPVIINRKGYFDEFIKKVDRKIIAVEMEGYGLVRAVNLSDTDTKVILIKCVMDKTEDKDKDIDDTTPEERKDYAALVSALCVQKVIEKDLLV